MDGRPDAGVGKKRERKRWPSIDQIGAFMVQAKKQRIASSSLPEG